MSRRRPRLAECKNMSDFVRGGFAQAVTPSASSGWTTYDLGRLFLPADKNYCTNPSAGVYTDANTFPNNWGVYWNVGGTPAYARIVSPTGGYGCRITYTSSADSAKEGGLFHGSGAGTFAQGETVTASFYAKGSVSGVQAVIVAEGDNAAGGWLENSTTNITLTSEWARYSKTYTLTQALVSRARVGIYFTGIGTGDTIDASVCNVMVEKSPIATPYFDGYTSGCSWDGTAHASASSRAAAALTVPLTLGSTAFTVAGRYSGLWAHNDSLAHNMLTLKAGADARATVYKHTDQKLYASATDGTDTATSASAASTLAASTVNTFVARVTWAGTVDLMLNGAVAAQGDASAVAAQTIDSIVIDPAALAYIGPLVISPQRRSDAWATAISADSGAAFSDPSRLMRDFLGSDDVITPLGADSVGYRRVSGSPPLAERGLVVFDGDSLTWGDPVHSTGSYPAACMASLSVAYDWTNEAVAAQTAQDLIDHAATVDARYNAASYTHNILCVWIGANGEAVDTIADLPAYCAARQATGWRVVVLTMTPITGQNEKRNTVNAYIKANWQDWADALADVTADSRIGDDGDDEDTTYFVDGTHMTAAGYAIVAGIVATAIESLI